MRPTDTSPEAAAVLRKARRKLSVAERLAHASAMSPAVQDIALAGIRARHPDVSDRELQLRFA